MRIKTVLLTGFFMISVSIFAQKDELKALKKIYEKEKPSTKDFEEYTAILVKAEPLIANATEMDKVYFNFYKVNSPFMDLMLAMEKPENSNNLSILSKYLTVQNVSQMTSGFNDVVAFEKKSGKQVYTKEIEETIFAFKPILVNFAVALSNESKFKEAALILHSIYELDNKDVEKLYYAANYAVNGKDYLLGLQYYQELKNLNYTGEGVLLYATNKESQKEESFNTKQERDIYVKGGSHEKPRDEKIPSKRPEIFKNIALILVELGKSDEAKAAIQEARKESPEDVSLIITESDLYLKANDMVTYKRLISEALEKNPNNADLVFNLGVISYNNKELVEAEKYYLRTIEIDPKYENAYLNLAILKLDSEKSLIDKMNKLGTSPADTKKYDVLKKQREDVYKSAIPYLEKVTELDSENVEAIKTLIGVYNALEMTDKAKALKDKLKK
ncbi:NrfG FOG, TPR repeat [Flavobacteriaceae bacterium]